MMINSPAPRGSYIPAALARYCLNGDAYVPVTDSYQICCGEKHHIPYPVFQRDLVKQIALGHVAREGSRLYLTRTLRYEGSAAMRLADMLLANTAESPAIPDEVTVGALTLCAEQRSAVEVALSHLLSLILGGAGSGKTSLIQAIASLYDGKGYRVLCAPTGKAARNLTARTGYIARTVHSALGMRPNDDFLSPVIWESVGLVIVDEASMMTLEMFAGILCKVRQDCRIVLLGDYNQLLSVGSGNILPDLLWLNTPNTRLESNHRQANHAAGLLRNVVGFSKLHCIHDLTFDDSFVMEEIDESAVCKALADEAVLRYLRGESVQVLSPYNKATNSSEIQADKVRTRCSVANTRIAISAGRSRT